MDRIMRAWPWKHADTAIMKKSLFEHIQKLEPDALIASWSQRIDDIIAASDFEGVLRIYDNKGLLRHAAQKLGLKGLTEYCDYVLGRLVRPEGVPLLTELRKLVPAIPHQL